MTLFPQAILVATFAGAIVVISFLLKKNIHIWMIGYLKTVWRQFRLRKRPIRHVYVCVADHFEPYNGGVDKETATRRVDAWVDNYPDMASRFTDSDGNHPRVTLFYPEEEYDPDLLDKLARITREGFVDVEIHLHHDNDTAESLKGKLERFKNLLHDRHGLLRKGDDGRSVIYAFVHGNWALDNSRPDGRLCGVSNELQVLINTGCYMDMTLPSAPSPTQTAKINSLYFARGRVGKNKSHNFGRDVIVGGAWNDGNELLIAQGPLGFTFSSRKFGIFPRIEASELSSDALPSTERLEIWKNSRVSVVGCDDTIFVKLHTHGAEDRNIKAMIEEGGYSRLWALFENFRKQNQDTQLHYVSAFDFYQAIRRISSGR
jgi:hypothetical protein